MSTDETPTPVSDPGFNLCQTIFPFAHYATLPEPVCARCGGYCETSGAVGVWINDRFEGMTHKVCP